MKQSVRFRLPRDDASAWMPAFTGGLHGSPLTSDAMVSNAKSATSGASLADPSVVIAIIAAGAQVLAAAIAAFAVVAAQRKKDQNSKAPGPQTLVLVVHGVRGSAPLRVEPGVSPSAALADLIDKVGDVREISFGE